jgi:phosphatidate phosphatase APP1
LIGDSSEEDPEIYAELARKHPRRIREIWIREANPGEMSADRVAAARKGLAMPLLVFTQPKELSSSR